MRTIFALLIGATIHAASIQNDLPPRLQWSVNGGYCGEVSVIAGGLYFGQYMSQYTARDIALKGAPQTSYELLLGENDQYAATQMRLQSAEWDYNDEENTSDFLVWVKQQVIQGNPVAIGVYMNQSIFHPGHKGDADYDHIVTVYQIDTNHPLTDPNYYPDDVFYFSDHGLYKEDGSHRPYLFHSRFDVQKSRHDANLPDSPIYSLPLCNVDNGVANYGLSIQSVVGDTLPVRVKTSVNSEPEMAKGNVPPAPESITLTATVSGLEAGQIYNLYRYNDVNAVPTSQFNGQASKAVKQWQIQGTSTYTVTETIQSNETAVYRAVRASAP